MESIHFSDINMYDKILNIFIVFVGLDWVVAKDQQHVSIPGRISAAGEHIKKKVDTTFILIVGEHEYVQHP